MAGNALGGTLSQWASGAMVSLQDGTAHWTVSQPTGTPDMSACSDSTFPRRSNSSDLDPFWMELSYPVPVYASHLRLHEAGNSTSIYRIDLVDVRGGLHTIWRGVHTTRCAGRFALNFPQTSYLVSDVRIYTRALNEEEIDAVELIGLPGPNLEVTLTGCSICRPGDLFSVDVRLTNPSFESKPVAVKIGMRLPGGIPQNLFGKDLELVLPAEADQTIASIFSVVLPEGMATGEWYFEGALLEPELGETYSRDAIPFVIRR
ncbi:MAG: hypothetical protein HYY20_06730 [Candidatus Tectomicrobia bacterium]|uniref:Pappalysin-1 SD scarf domain-containing protein n=1 Tax=Tectimicrobiota bacterium TaxID=2528274 RepID=A0A932CNB7_UNCTE|nr:hypothetical protein [Candidatus Tectomicrobia bacterium]